MRTAREAGVDESLLAELGDGYTGALAVLRSGDGPTVALRVDIDEDAIPFAVDVLVDAIRSTR